jgi:hypothetical protein
MMDPLLAGLEVADPPERWRALGFAVDAGERIALGGVVVQLGASGEGITGWTLTGVAGAGDIDGLATTVTRERSAAPAEQSAAPAERSAAPAERSAATTEHGNGAIGIDHVVIVTGDFERTSDALAARGMPLRLVRETDRDRHRQGFRRLGPAIMEIVEVPGLDATARFWGLVVVVEDLEGLHARLDPHLHEIRPAVQEGRRIATLDGSAGLTPRLAFMDPE